MTPPAQRVQFILGQESQDVEHESHPVFSEMEELYVGEDGNMEWKETARWWIKSLLDEFYGLVFKLKILTSQPKIILDEAFYGWLVGIFNFCTE